MLSSMFLDSCLFFVHAMLGILESCQKVINSRERIIDCLVSCLQDTDGLYKERSMNLIQVSFLFSLPTHPHLIVLSIEAFRHLCR